MDSIFFQKNFRNYWISQIISLSGAWIQQVSQVWLFYTLTKSAAYLGLISFLNSFPILIFTLFAGVIADKYARKKILLLTQIISFFQALLLGILIHLNLIKLWHIALGAILLGIVNAFEMPARQAFISDLVPLNKLTSAIALQSISFNLARFIGPILAGFIISYFNFYICFYLNALSILPLIGYLIKYQEISPSFSKSYKNPFLTSLKEGFLFLFSKKDLLCTLIAVAIITLFGVSVITLLPLIAEEIFNLGSKGYSILISSIGLGSLLAGFLIIIRGDIPDKKRYILKSSLIVPISLLGMVLSPNFYFTLIFTFILGFSFVNFFTISNSFLQHSTDQPMKGRIMSLFSLVFLGFTPIGNLLIGLLAEKLDLKILISSYSLISLFFLISLLRTLQKTK